MSETAAETNGQAMLIDVELERMLVAAVIADPRHLAQLREFAAVDLGDMQARAAFSALRNVEHRGEPLTPENVRAELAAEMLRKEPDRKLIEHPQVGDLAWFDRLTATPLPAGEALISSWAYQILGITARRNAAVEEAEEAARAEYEVDDIALRDVEPDEHAAAEAAASAPRARWIQPLEEFLGEEEPDDNDDTDWIIRDILPRGESAIIAGPPKGGKTWAMLDLGVSVALGTDWIGTMANTIGAPARVLCLAFEDGQRRLRKRVWELARARGTTPNNPLLRAHLSVGREPLSLPGDERAFSAELKAWKPTLVLIDNLTRVMVGDQNAIKDAKRFGDVTAKLCSDVGAAVVFLHHTNKIGPLMREKRSEGDPFELIRGSGDLVASARHLVLMRPIESPDGAKLSDVRMRGNLDLRREDFVLGFERAADPTGRWVARLSYGGETEQVHDELAARRRERQAERKAARAVGGSVSAGADSVDERIYATISSMVAGGARDLCTLEQIKTSCGVRRQEVRPALDRLVHAKRVRVDQIRRNEGGVWRTRAIFVPESGGGG